MTRVIGEDIKSTVRQNHNYGRPRQIEDVTNLYIIHPLSDYVVKFAISLGLSPNFISVLGLGCGILAAVFYYHLPQMEWVTGAFAAMICWHVFDGADGRLARKTGKTSAFGRIIDGLCDHFVFGAVYISLAFYMIETGTSISVWWLVVAAILSHTVQAASYEERRQKYQRRLAGIQRCHTEEDLTVIHGKRSAVAVFYDGVQKLVAGGNYGLDTALQKIGGVAGGSKTAAQYIHKTVPLIKAWGLLNANKRTLMIFICAYTGWPILFFIFEVVVLNLVLGILMAAEWHFETKLASRITAETAS